MAIGLDTTGVHHIALRSADLRRSREFYVDLLGFPVLMEASTIFLFTAGSSVFAVVAPTGETQSGDRFSPHRVGLDHVALTCEDESSLERVASALEQAGVWNTGVKTDEVLGKRYVAFRDPDGIKWEYYMR